MLEIRFATVADSATILRFIRALAEYEKEPQAVLTSEQTLREQLSSPSPPFECLIAERRGGPEGFTPEGFALFFHTYSTWRGRRGVWLEDLFVLPEKRRGGTGKALLQRVAAIARERNCARLEWSVLGWNEPAIRFYEAQGAKLLTEWTICRVTDEALVRLASPGS
jgi:GNAT superfamily N-acetyltransferase